MQIIELLNQYRSLVTYVMKAFGCANINKSIRNNIIEIIFLFMVIPGRINFLQLGRFGRRPEQCYRQTFWRGGMDWLEFNLHISAGAFFKAGGGNRVGIATAPSYISKSGKETAHVGRFWSGCSGATAPQPRPWRADKSGALMLLHHRRRRRAVLQFISSIVIKVCERSIAGINADGTPDVIAREPYERLALPLIIEKEPAGEHLLGLQSPICGAAMHLEAEVARHDADGHLMRIARHGGECHDYTHR